MTEKLYLDDSYCFENQACVLKTVDKGIVLDRTCMYPGGGGQPCDTGEIVLGSGVSLDIVAIKENESGELLHQCAGTVPCDLSGCECHVLVDGARRMALMRYHTALHVFNTVMLRAYNGLITGVGMKPDGAHIDFKIDNYHPEMAQVLEQEVNAVLDRGLPIKAYYVTEDELRNRPELLRTIDAMPPVRNNSVRVVEIEGYEAQACGGTHARNTAEVGRLSVRKISNKGKNNRRFYISLQPPAGV